MKSEYKKNLIEEQLRILDKKGTEIAGTSELNDEKRKGKYYCVACGNLLFDSDAKFDSGTGWPSFTKPASEESVIDGDNSSLALGREILCKRCEGHLGHVFSDGPKLTGLRYCMNGVVLKFEEEDEKI